MVPKVRIPRLVARSPIVSVTVLTGLSEDGRGVLAVRREQAVSDRDAVDTLESATTFAEARANPVAAALVADGLDSYLDLVRAYGNTKATGKGHESFDVELFFGEAEGGWWRPDALQATINCLEEQDLAVELLRERTLVLKGPDGPPYVPAADRDRLERGLLELGLTVVGWEALGGWYAGDDVGLPPGLGCGAPGCDGRIDADTEDGAWCGTHGQLLLDHRMDDLEGTDNHYHPLDRQQCPACNGWVSA